MKGYPGMNPDCQHPKDAVRYNPYNHVIQCHRCGQVMPDSNELFMSELARQRREMDFEREQHNTFIGEIWTAIYPDETPGSWDYPAQVIRCLQNELSDLRKLAAEYERLRS